MDREQLTAEQQRWLAQSQMLVNRVNKTLRHLRKWARREGVSCFRVYDRDIPEVPLAIDWYDGRLYAAAYARQELSAEWVAAMINAVAAELGVPPERVFCKQRERQRGSAQYQKLGANGQRFEVVEHGLKFLVNLGDYLDTGLFLDHRITRQRVLAEARAKDVLNLFSYTGSFSVAAAAGGATRTTSVDLSKTYSAWAQDNLRTNGFDPACHPVVTADVRAFLAEAERSYDLVIVDPPTFSNSARTEVDLDLNRDYIELLERVVAVTRPRGVIYFSTNSRRLRFDPAALSGCDVKDISESTIPPDFRNKRIHRCWRIERRS